MNKFFLKKTSKKVSISNQKVFHQILQKHSSRIQSQTMSDKFDVQKEYELSLRWRTSREDFNRFRAVSTEELSRADEEPRHDIPAHWPTHYGGNGLSQNVEPQFYHDEWDENGITFENRDTNDGHIRPTTYSFDPWQWSTGNGIWKNRPFSTQHIDNPSEPHWSGADETPRVHFDIPAHWPEILGGKGLGPLHISKDEIWSHFDRFNRKQALKCRHQYVDQTSKRRRTDHTMTEAAQLSFGPMNAPIGWVIG